MPETAQKPFRVGIFSTWDGADQAVARLLDTGFDRHQISVLASDKATQSHFHAFEHEQPAGSNTPAAVATGGTIGAIFGGLTTLGVATALSVPLLIAGPSFLIGGAVAGGLIGAMSTRGIERELADFYDQALSSGQILVAVEDHSDDAELKLLLAERVFTEVGAEPMALSEG